MKACKRCDKTKLFSDFREDARYKDGYGSWCIECHRHRNSEWAKENRKRLTKKAAEYRANNPERINASNKKWKDANKDKTSAQFKKWRLANKKYDCARQAKRKAAKLRATPPWVDLDEIAEFYRNKPDGFQVDHIVPLVSPIVCGLHCMANLQYLTPSENQSKKNYWWPDMPDIEAAYAQGRLFA